MNKLSLHKKREFINSYKKFVKHFSSFINKAFKYIIIVDNFETIKESVLENVLVCFIEKYELHEIAIGVTDYSKVEFPLSNSLVHIIKLKKTEINEYKNIYQLFSICNNIQFLTRDLNGRLLPSDCDCEDLLRMELF